jgi:hypothetical protein
MAVCGGQSFRISVRVLGIRNDLIVKPISLREYQVQAISPSLLQRKEGNRVLHKLEISAWFRTTFIVIAPTRSVIYHQMISKIFENRDLYTLFGLSFRSKIIHIPDVLTILGDLPNIFLTYFLYLKKQKKVYGITLLSVWVSACVWPSVCIYSLNFLGLRGLWEYLAVCMSVFRPPPNFC